MADALATVTPVMVTARRGKPDAAVLRAVLYGWAFHKARRETVKLSAAEAAALAWLREKSLRVTALDEKDLWDSITRPQRLSRCELEVLPAGIIGA